MLLNYINLIQFEIIYIFTSLCNRIIKSLVELTSQLKALSYTWLWHTWSQYLKRIAFFFFHFISILLSTTTAKEKSVEIGSRPNFGLISSLILEKKKKSMFLQYWLYREKNDNLQSMWHKFKIIPFRVLV